MSNRKNDIRGEKALGLFLDKYFYPKLCEKENFAGAKRIYSSEAQKAGTDVLITHPSGTTIAIDEKAQLHYINNPRPTFAFEVTFYSENTQDIEYGWFVNDSNKTDCYILIWIDAARTNQINRLVEEDFKEITVFFVPKKEIIQYLSGLGYSIDKIKVIASNMRSGTTESPYKLSTDTFIYYTNERYDEKPINVVIGKKALSNIAYGIYKVTRNSFTKLSK